MFAQHHYPFLQAEKVFAKLSILQMMKKESPVKGLRIQNGKIYLYTDTAGYTNTYLLHPKKDPGAATTSGKSKNSIKSIDFDNVRLTVDDRKENKFHDFAIRSFEMQLDDDDSSMLVFNTKTDILIHSLAFNKNAGSFVQEKTFTGKFDLQYHTKTNQLSFDSIDIKISGHPFNLSGRFDLQGPGPQFNLRAHTKQIGYEFAKAILTKKIATAMSIVQVEKKIDADVSLGGPLNAGDPVLNVTWNIKNSHLGTPFFDFDDASLDGFYTNEVTPGLPRRDPNSKIVINRFSASWHGLPVTSSQIEILNLYEPTLICDLQSSFPLPRLNTLIGSDNIVLESGDGSLNLTYKGPIVRNNNTNSFINGQLTFKNGTILYAPRDVYMKNVNGDMAFRNSDVFIENLDCDVLDNKFRMEGAARNLLTLVNTDPNKVNIDWKIYSPALNLNSFLYLLKPRKKIIRKKTGKSGLENISTRIDAILDRGRINVSLQTPRMNYKKLQAKNVLADVTLLQDRYLLNNVSMEQAGGKVNLSGSLVTEKVNYHTAEIAAAFNNVNVSQVFSEFNNFGQDGINAKNITGQLTAKVNAQLALNDDGNAYPNSIKSIVDFSLKNGSLVDFDPVKKLQNLLFKNRDFENIKFAELKNRLEISNQEVKINRMEIQSNVLSLFVEGVYSMKGNTDMSIQLPLSNLKKRKADYKPENIGTDKRGGASIYLRGRPGKDGNIQFKPDLFKKFRGSKD